MAFYPKSSATRTGFTLIELLVVVSIIAVLIAILLPSLNNARNNAKAAACLANVRSVGLSYIMYVSDKNNNHNINGGGGNAGANYLTETLPYHNWDMKVYLCPAAPEPAPLSFSKNASSGGWGSKRYAFNGDWNSALYWKIVKPNTNDSTKVTATNPDGLVQMDGNTITSTSPGYKASYTINSWIFAGGKWTPPSQSSNATPMVIYSSILAQSTTPLFTDGMWIDTNRSSNGINITDMTDMPCSTDGGDFKGSDNADFPPSSPSPAPFTNGASNASWRCWVDRHNQAVNGFFADGHGGPIKLIEWFHTPTWYNGWVPQANLPFLPHR